MVGWGKRWTDEFPAEIYRAVPRSIKKIVVKGNQNWGGGDGVWVYETPDGLSFWGVWDPSFRDTRILPPIVVIFLQVNGLPATMILRPPLLLLLSGKSPSDRCINVNFTSWKPKKYNCFYLRHKCSDTDLRWTNVGAVFLLKRNNRGSTKPDCTYTESSKYWANPIVFFGEREVLRFTYF